MTVEKQAFVQPVSDRIPVPTTLTNVFATLHGTDPASADRVYVVSAHYDSRVTDVLVPDAPGGEPGADDDASGVDAVLELARVFAAHPMQATIIFAAFPGEEQGLYGSAHFAAQLKAAGANVLGDLNMDIIGSSLGGNGVRDRHDIRLFNEGVPTSETPKQAGDRQAVGGENDGVSRQLARFVKETGENDTTDMTVALRFRRDRYLRSGDQVSFLTQGYPAVRFTEPNENYDHEHQDVRVENGVQFGDLPQFVDFGFLARVTRVVGSAIAALASAPRPPVNTATVNTQLTYNTDLKWTKDPEPDVVGYEVVWRDSTEPLWTHSRFVGDVDAYTLVGINKDDWQVGVRAVDRDGNKSPVAFAVRG
jgi:Zn-dependent M28 family amino/carboxypeptidase